MLYNLLYPLAEKHLILNLFKYITFRSGGAMISSLLISFIIGPKLIKYFHYIQNGGQPIRLDGPQSHLITKVGIPTMGGIMIIISVLVSTVLWADLTNLYIWITLFITISYGLIGFRDDYLKITKRNSKGLSGKQKLLMQIVIAFLSNLSVYLIMDPNYASHLAVPFFKNILIDLGYFSFIFTIIVVIGSSNAVNITDGLDGLAIVPIALCALCFAIISYLVGNSIFANYLQVHHIVKTGELTIFCSALVGASLGFLWFNAPPAKVFMGDTGSLALGGAIGIISVITKHEIVLSIIGGLFVIEAFSVILQVYYFKLSKGKRLFLMAPIHHHFEKLGWHETTIVIRFWIIAVIFALVGLSTLKIR